MNPAVKKWLPVPLLAIAVAIAAAILWLPQPDPEPVAVGTGGRMQTLPGATDTDPSPGAHELASAAPVSGSAPAATPAAPAGGDAAVPPAPTKPEYELAAGVSMPAWKDALAERVREASPTDFERNRERANSGDADAAYWLHLFYLSCENAPRSNWQLDNRLSGFERYLERMEASGSDLDPGRHANRMSDLEVSFLRCSFLGPDFDAGRAALDWLGIAADLGHMGAQRMYHFQARQLLTGFWYARIFEQPDLIPEFKSRSDRYAKALLKTGHPQAYVLMARMLTIGDVYEQDHAKAHAYARAAELIGMDGVRADARRMQEWIAGHLDPALIPDAEKMALRILRDR